MARGCQTILKSFQKADRNCVEPAQTKLMMAHAAATAALTDTSVQFIKKLSDLVGAEVRVIAGLALTINSDIDVALDGQALVGPAQAGSFLGVQKSEDARMLNKKSKALAAVFTVVGQIDLLEPKPSSEVLYFQEAVAALHHEWLAALFCRQSCIIVQACFGELQDGESVQVRQQQADMAKTLIDNDNAKSQGPVTLPVGLVAALENNLKKGS